LVLGSNPSRPNPVCMETIENPEIEHRMNLPSNETLFPSGNQSYSPRYSPLKTPLTPSLSTFLSQPIHLCRAKAPFFSNRNSFSSEKKEKLAGTNVVITRSKFLAIVINNNVREVI
jgi:hypothetical protein